MGSNDGATMKTWYKQNNLEYEHNEGLIEQQLLDAEKKAGVPPLLLLPVNYTNATAWANEMKKD